MKDNHSDIVGLTPEEFKKLARSQAQSKRTPAPPPSTVSPQPFKELERLADASVTTVAEYHGLTITPCEYCLKILAEESDSVIFKTGLPYKELLTELIAALPCPTSNDETMADPVVKLEVTPVRFNIGVWSELLSNKTPAEIWQWMVEKGLVYDYLIDARQGDSEDKE